MKSRRLRVGRLHSDTCCTNTCIKYIDVPEHDSMIESLCSACDKGKCLKRCTFSSSHCGRLKPPRCVPVGLACLAWYILLHVNEIIQGCGSYLRRAPAFLVPKHISSGTNALGAANWEAPLENVCRMLLVSLRSSLETSALFYFQNKVFFPDLRRISGFHMFFFW